MARDFYDDEPEADEERPIPSLREAYPVARDARRLTPALAPPAQTKLPAPAPDPVFAPPMAPIARPPAPPNYEPWADGRRRRASDDPRFDMALGGGAVALFFAGFLGWAATAPLDAAVIAAGVVSVTGDRQTVQHRDGGTIAVLNVREGQTVAAGDVLIELSATQTLAEKESLTSQLLDFQLQRAQLIADAEGRATVTRPAEWESLAAEDLPLAEAALARHQREMASRRSAQNGGAETDARTLGLRSQIAALDTQESLLRDELEGLRELAAEQLVPLTRVRATERALAELQGQRAALRASIGEVQEDKAELRRRVEARIAEIAPQLAALRAKVESARVRAPVAGDVVGLKANTVGGVVQPGEPILQIVPAGEALIVKTQVRPQDADDLRPGMIAEVRITAFNSADQPTLRGLVTNVSADRLVDAKTGDPFFEATIEVAPEDLAGTVDSLGRPFELRAGLPAEVIVPTRERTALDYFMEPLTRLVRVSGRED